MRTDRGTEREMAGRLGDLPAFLAAREVPDVQAELLRHARHAYLGNPLPAA